MRILLFDWYSGGHHELYLAAFTRALAPHHAIVAAAPPEGAAAAAAAGAEPVVLGESFPAMDTSRRFSRERRAALRREVELLRETVRAGRADHAVHLFADGALRALVGRSIGAPLTVLLFRPRGHLVELDGLPRSPRERFFGMAYEATLTAWRRSRGAHAVLTLDPVAADRWSRGSGAPAFAVPEPPVTTPPPSERKREGAVLFGALSERKGIHHLAAALERDRRSLRLVLAGATYPEYAPTLRRLVRRLEAAGIDVDLRAEPHDERAVLEVLAGARAALLPYVGHIGMSRVLLEAASVGTPVVAHAEGLVGHLVRTRGLGLTVDCRDPEAFAASIHALVGDPNEIARYSEALRAFAEDHAPDRFAAAVRAPFEAGLTKRPSNWRTRPVARS
jgi:Glycosyl transferases group 1